MFILATPLRLRLLPEDTRDEVRTVEVPVRVRVVYRRRVGERVHDGTRPLRLVGHQRDTHPLLPTSYGRITTFTFRSSPATAWNAFATRVASSCSASFVRSGLSQRSTLNLVTSPSKPSSRRTGTTS